MNKTEGRLDDGPAVATPSPSRRRVLPTGHTLRAARRRAWLAWSTKQPFDVPARTTWSTGLRRARVTGLTLLGLEFLALGWWSSVLDGRSELGWDFAIGYQPVYLITHGHLDPFSTSTGSFYYQIHAEFIQWLVAVAWRVWPYPEMLSWIQDAAIVGAEVVVFCWACDAIARSELRHQLQPSAPFIAGTALLLLIADPWIIWVASFDYHTEVLGTFFALVCMRSLVRDKRRAWLYALLTLACGDVAITYLLGVGISALVAGRRWSRRGTVLVLVSAAATLAVAYTHNDLGSGVQTAYNYLVGAHGIPSSKNVSLMRLVTSLFERPWRPAAALFGHRVDILADTLPGGFIGMFTPWTFATSAMALVENGLHPSNAFISPAFQDFLVYVTVPLGTVLIVLALGRSPRLWIRRCAVVLALLTVADALGWAVVWFPQAGTRWLRISSSTGQVLDTVERRIPVSDEVIASQGIEGAFAGRRWVYPIFQLPSRFPVRTRAVWFVVAPAQGIEVEPAHSADEMLGDLSGSLGASLIYSGSGVWLFRWTPPRATRSVSFSALASDVPAWSVSGPASVPVTSGPPSHWYVTSNGRSGYVIDHAYWYEVPGSLEANVKLASTGSVNVEVWDATRSVLLARARVPATDGPLTIELPAELRRVQGEPVDTGSFIWRISPPLPSAGDQVEIRVWSPGKPEVTVYSVGLRRVR